MRAVGELMLTGLDYLFIALASVAAGLVNAIAGGGTLITFPVLTAVGVPAVPANVTNTVALCPGFFGATARSARGAPRSTPAAVDHRAGGRGRRHRRRRCCFSRPTSRPSAGSSRSCCFSRRSCWPRRTGCGRGSSEVEVAPRVRSRVGCAGRGAALPWRGLWRLFRRRAGRDDARDVRAAARRLADAAERAQVSRRARHQRRRGDLLRFLRRGRVAGRGVMAAGALLGGAFGGRLASRIRPETLRWVVVAIGAIAAAIYFVK